MRITRDDMLMEIAHTVAKRGTCSRLQVGAVISRDGRIITTGYNGAPAGMAHCIHRDDEDTTGCDNAEHAERNAIAWAARHGLALEGSELHVTHAPCSACARSVINAGIKKVSFHFAYRLKEGVELLRTAGIQVVDIGLSREV